MATTYLTDTQGTPTNNLKWTWSSWIKRGELATEGHSAVENIFTTYVDGSNLFYIRFNDTDFIDIRNIASVGTGGRLITNAVFRDVGAWYHIVVVYDSANASAGDRLRLYVNGVEETSFSLDTNPSSSQVCTMNADTRVVELGRISSASANFSGVLAHTHFCDGQAYAASDFGEFDATSGIWIAEPSPSVTYGNNGFFLKYQDTSNYGDDSSGNTNDFTLSGTMTQTKDTPDNNFPTMNVADNYYPNMTYSDGNLTIKSDHPAPACSTMGVSSGKWYCEGKAIVSTSGNDWMIGVSSSIVVSTAHELGHYPSDWSYRGVDGDYRNSNTNTSYGDTYTAGDIIGVAIDLTNNKLYFSKNGVWQNSGVPTSGATGTGAISISMETDVTSKGVFQIAAGADASANDYTWSMNFGNGYFGTTAVASANADDAGIGSFEYDVPAGYYAICTTNLGDQS